MEAPLTKETVKARVANRHLIAIYGMWSWDYWDEVNHKDVAMRRRDEGPSSFSAVCAGSWSGQPTETEIDVILACIDASVDGMGRAVRIGYSVLEDDRLVSLTKEKRCHWSGDAVEPGKEFEFIQDAKSAEDLHFFL